MIALEMVRAIIDPFQSQNRDSDLTLLQLNYEAVLESGNDFIGPVGRYDFHFLQGAPKVRSSYSTLIRPFDKYVWYFLLASVVAISFALIFINRVYSKLTKEIMKETPFQSTYK